METARSHLENTPQEKRENRARHSPQASAAQGQGANPFALPNPEKGNPEKNCKPLSGRTRRAGEGTVADNVVVRPRALSMTLAGDAALLNSRAASTGEIWHSTRHSANARYSCKRIINNSNALAESSNHDFATLSRVFFCSAFCVAASERYANCGANWVGVGSIRRSQQQLYAVSLIHDKTTMMTAKRIVRAPVLTILKGQAMLQMQPPQAQALQTETLQTETTRTLKTQASPMQASIMRQCRRRRCTSRLKTAAPHEPSARASSGMAEQDGDLRPKTRSASASVVTGKQTIFTQKPYWRKSAGLFAARAHSAGAALMQTPLTQTALAQTPSTGRPGVGAALHGGDATGATGATGASSRPEATGRLGAIWGDRRIDWSGRGDFHQGDQQGQRGVRSYRPTPFFSDGGASVPMRLATMPRSMKK